MTREDIIRKLTSRKLWVALVGFVTGLLVYFGQTEAQAAQLGALIMSFGSLIAYIFGEGMIDAARESSDKYFIQDEAHPPEGADTAE